MTTTPAVCPFPTITQPQLRHDVILDAWRRDEPVRPIQMPYGRWAWMVTRYEDVRLVMTDPRFSRRAAAADDAPRKTAGVVQRGSLASMDGADHSRLRRLVSRALTVRRMEDLRPHTGEVVDDLLAKIAGSEGPVDLVSEFALPVPMMVICHLLDIPYEDRERFRSWTSSNLSLAPAGADGRTAADNSREHLTAYLGELISLRRRHPGDDLLSALVAARDGGDTFSETELIWLSHTLLSGGYETTAQILAKSIYLLLGLPEVADDLRRAPEAWPAAVEELLRYIPLGAGNALPLVALEAVELSGITIGEGDYVITAPGAANNDPDVFQDPDRFDVHREAKPHLGLGHGPHFCLGANLARMELQVALESLFARFPQLRLAVPVEQVPWLPAHAIWGLAELPVLTH